MSDPLKDMFEKIKAHATYEATKDYTIEQIFEVIDSLNKEIMRRLNVLEQEKQELAESSTD